MRNRSLILGCALMFTLAAGCKRDPCVVDDIESNNSADEATDLGFFSDAETRMELPLTLHEPGDIDTFKFKIQDQGSDGNPELSVWATGQDDEELTVTVTLKCAGDPMVEFSCDGFNEVFTPEDGGTCTRTGRGEQHFDVQYDCSGNLSDSTDGSDVVLSVQRGPSASVNGEACAAYDLEILTD